MRCSRWTRRKARTGSLSCTSPSSCATIHLLTPWCRRGNFADSFGEDFLGLRELGIAAEFGLNSLTIPKRLLKGKNKAGVTDGPLAYVNPSIYDS